MIGLVGGPIAVPGPDRLTVRIESDKAHKLQLAWSICKVQSQRLYSGPVTDRKVQGLQALGLHAKRLRAILLRETISPVQKELCLKPWHLVYHRHGGRLRQGGVTARGVYKIWRAGHQRPDKLVHLGVRQRQHIRAHRRR